MTKFQIACWFSGIMAVYLGLMVFETQTDYRYTMYLPLSTVQECVPSKQWLENHGGYRTLLVYQGVSVTTYSAIICLMFVFMIYKLKGIPREFSMVSEFVIILLILIFQIIIYLLILMFLYLENNDNVANLYRDDNGPPYMDHSRYIYYITIFDLLIMLETGLHVLQKTYKPNEIVPFPINEDVIRSFDLAIIMPTSMTHFYAYLENLYEFNEALIIFGLHADIRQYIKMVEDGMHTDIELHEKAVEIFEEYIIEDCKWKNHMASAIEGGDDPSDKNFENTLDQAVNKKVRPSMSSQSELIQHKFSQNFEYFNPIPPEILHEIRAGYHSESRTLRFVLNTGLFSDLYLFTIERLRQYYDDFKESGEPYEQLRSEVVKQEVLYEILKRYDLISI